MGYKCIGWAVDAIQKTQDTMWAQQSSSSESSQQILGTEQL